MDILRFHINWGDGEIETTGYVESGENKIVTHEYDSQGDYIIRATAEDEYENESPEATHPISIPREHFILRLNGHRPDNQARRKKQYIRSTAN